MFLAEECYSCTCFAVHMIVLFVCVGTNGKTKLEQNWNVFIHSNLFIQNP